MNITVQPGPDLVENAHRPLEKRTEGQESLVLLARALNKLCQSAQALLGLFESAL